jgi:hypothetical protein
VMVFRPLDGVLQALAGRLRARGATVPPP